MTSFAPLRHTATLEERRWPRRCLKGRVLRRVAQCCAVSCRFMHKVPLVQDTGISWLASSCESYPSSLPKTVSSMLWNVRQRCRAIVGGARRFNEIITCGRDTHEADDPKREGQPLGKSHSVCRRKTACHLRTEPERQQRGTVHGQCMGHCDGSCKLPGLPP